MAVDPFKLLVVRSAGPLLKWEWLSLEHISATGHVQMTMVESTTAMETPRGSNLFHRMVRAAEGSEMLAQVEEEANDNLRGDSSGSWDAILFLSGCKPTTAQLHDTRHGCWSFESADGTNPASVPPGARESFAGERITRFALTDAADRTTLRQGAFLTRASSPLRTADEVLELAATWPALVISEIHNHGAAQREPRTRDEAGPPLPSDLSIWMHRIARFLTRGEQLGIEQNLGDWNIGMLHQPIHELLKEGGNMNVRWFPSPSRGKGRLEGFGYHDGAGELNVLYRKTDGESGHSSIARLRPKPDNILKRSRTMLDVGRDHDYPYIVTVDDLPHMLRSVRSEGTTELYRLNDTNDGVDPLATLVSQALIAPTLFEYMGTWWLMGSMEPLAESTLYLFHGPTPRGPFAPHAMNPVKCDPYGTRPAGTPFIHDGKLYRPALDAEDPAHPCVVINEVTSLTPDRFAEHEVRRIDGFHSTAYGRGVRTLCAMGDVTLVDGLRSPVVSGKKANAMSGRRRKQAKQRNE